MANKKQFGALRMEHTEVWGCGVVDSARAGIYFNNLGGSRQQIVKNSSIHASQRNNMLLDNVSNVHISGNFFAKAIGNNLHAINLNGSNNIFTKNLAV